ncbi:sugar nucleotide-binding protein [Pseudoalteromonas phenolica]|uniref:sugar nucleotide-binding protein n=1 Tax=Pseudoalteromonas phenolica TaxID=161398 RepID=UPI0025A3C167|nr:sugar nucleotide-binding protein [Pseudoalteromonas phenolica]
MGCPTSASGLAKYLWQLAEQKRLEQVYHYSDLGVASWYDFAVAIQGIAFEKGLLDKKIPIQLIPGNAYPTPVKRPVFSLLYKKQNGNAENWKEALKTVITELLNEAGYLQSSDYI